MSVHLPARMEHSPMQRLGAHACDGGVHFGVFSAHAERIEVCVFDAGGSRELRRLELHPSGDDLFSGFLPGFGVGLVYGLRAHGPFDPERGQRFNPHKLLLDPYAREIVGSFHWNDEHFGYPLGHPDGARAFDRRDNATSALKARVAAPCQAATRPPRPRRAAADVVLYEAHVKGLTRLHPEVPEALRGSFSGIGHPAVIAHLQRLGVTTLCLLPVHYALSEKAVVQRDLVNYWGYNTLGFFSPDPRLGSTRHDPTALNTEFRQMVDALHAAGIEVVLDVVFNHTAEGASDGPTLSFRGLDNPSWYRLLRDDASQYENWSHCGNTLNTAHPRVTQFVLDALRYWVLEMGVDGFRFDLAPSLGRDGSGRFRPRSAFMTALRQDPVLAEVHLIAEPWDGGPEGYQLGRFPGRFRDWNDRFRDSTRRYWLGLGTHRGEFARRLSASSDLFHHAGRRPWASVNFITAHDGFTLNDLVRYSRKHNEANGEGNRDGRDGEPCANCGVEGPSEDPAIVQLRRRIRRALLASLLLSQGTPMLLAGDEIGHTQQGNNNAYCQDGPISWVDWLAADEDMLAWVTRLLALRRAHPLLRCAEWFAADAGGDRPSLRWLTPRSEAMQTADWHDTAEQAFACQMTAPGQRSLLLLFNPERDPRTFLLPAGSWTCLADSSEALIHSGAREVPVPGTALVLLCGPSPDGNTLHD